MAIVVNNNLVSVVCYRNLTQVIVTKQVLFASRKNWTLREGERSREHEWHDEIQLLKNHQDQRAANILYAQSLGKASLVEEPKVDLRSYIIIYEMPVAKALDLRRYIFNHCRQQNSIKYIVWVWSQIRRRQGWLQPKELLNGLLKIEKVVVFQLGNESELSFVTWAMRWNSSSTGWRAARASRAHSPATKWRPP